MLDYEKWGSLSDMARKSMMMRLRALCVWADAAMGYGPGTRIGKKEAKRLGRLFYEPLVKAFEEFEDRFKRRSGK